MPESKISPEVISRIRSMMWHYVKHSTAKKTQAQEKSHEWNDRKESVCSDAFLRLRSCKSREDFAEYFSGTLCSAPHFLPEKEYLALSSLLMDGNAWQDLKSLAMLALSAISYTASKEEKE